ncbi:molybdopterin synthase sulfur carrier subunit [Rhizohabitans arisaemae]|uniref:molybdopterin synthase sulfur carrier subunit n=1 Tax=Rhizohabitans arisaemae TaxID=2720610 RepID=UPI0024B065BA|nr:molybdopterin synthase sulfur carrier subunit [Rhizohabitans arisaemae]
MAKPVTLVTFVLPTPLHNLVGGGLVQVFAVAETEESLPTLGSALDTLRRTHPRLEERIRDEHGEIRRHINVFVSGDNVRNCGGLRCPVGPGAEVYVLPGLPAG